jgi:hypothetical protein
MPFEKDFESSVAAQMQAELLRFAGKCHYDEEKKKIVYHSLKFALEAYLTLQREEMDRYKWLESEKSRNDLGGRALADWVNKYSSDFARYWRRTHVYIPPDDFGQNNKSDGNQPQK